MTRLARFAGFGKRWRRVTQPDSTRADPGDGEVARERIDPEALHEPILAALRTVHDPEIPVNVYDLGLIYQIAIAANGDVDIAMTLTTPACPVAGALPRQVEDAVSRVEGVGKVRVELVWDPPWSQDKMTEEAALMLGMM